MSRSDIGIISSIGPTRDGTLFYNTLPATPGIYTAKYDMTSGQLSSVQALQQFKGFAFFPEFSDDGSLAYSSRRDIPAPHQRDKQRADNPFEGHRSVT